MPPTPVASSPIGCTSAGGSSGAYVIADLSSLPSTGGLPCGATFSSCHAGALGRRTCRRAASAATQAQRAVHSDRRMRTDIGDRTNEHMQFAFNKRATTLANSATKRADDDDEEEEDNDGIVC